MSMVRPWQPAADAAGTGEPGKRRGGGALWSLMNRKKAMLALALLVPAPSLGVLAGMVWFPGTPVGKGIFVASKLWLFAWPAIWLKWVDRDRFGLSPARHGGFAAGLVSGMVLGLVVLLGYLAFGRRLIDLPFFTGKMREIGLGSLPGYLGGAAYWILVNSVMEEYVWRWFVYAKCETVGGPGRAVVFSAFCFTIHHFIALWSCCSAPVATACSLGVFLAGTTWSFIYMRYRSIWPAYLSHAIVDVAVFGVGGLMLATGAG
ncbi:MAG: CPBP family intramembrane metalloprotease [Lentisphaerae bacterium]|nr:CPBP family intramembrane metalloprotease [Lentisphaerota bacterium]